ncbi:hypothetical protein NDU88_002527 [Pleurodeles waltl]|uniref:Uncharacterized protein n=1 Tax=Pleurodeles waltl TaxID=8319 RepID=A0AAV7MPQ0_PLEWA|nr:hypothetical protein NDU88_002527 [Pleurodeles waltl]
MLGQVLEELRAIKLSQKEARKENQQLKQLNANLTLLSIGVTQVEQSVSHLEDAKNRQVSARSQIQAEPEELQLKLDEQENRSRRSNLRFTGVPEETETALSVTKVIFDLIYKCILPKKAGTKDDLSIMPAHRVPAKRITNFKYPFTILVIFVDYRIKEQILSKAKGAKKFNFDNSFSFWIFSDMLVSAAR